MVVDIQAQGQILSHGTAFFVSPTGAAITCVHVLDALVPGAKVGLLDKAGKVHSFAVVRIDRELDLALLISDAAPRFFALSANVLPNAGQGVFFAGFPVDAPERVGLPPTSIKHASVSSVDQHRSPLTGRVFQTIKVDQIVNPGHSGGPLFTDSDYVLIGVMRATLDITTVVGGDGGQTIAAPAGYGFAVPLLYLRTFLGELPGAIVTAEQPTRIDGLAGWYRFRLRQELRDHRDAAARNEELFRSNDALAAKGQESIDPPARPNSATWREVWNDPRSEALLGAGTIDALRPYYTGIERYRDLIEARETIRLNQWALTNRASLLNTHDKELLRRSIDLGAQAARLADQLK